MEKGRKRYKKEKGKVRKNLESFFSPLSQEYSPSELAEHHNQ